MQRQVRFWLVYTIAWLPFAASYVTLFVWHMAQPLITAVRLALINTLPAALLGVGVVAICRHLPWSSEHRGRFLSIHFLLAGVYVTLWIFSIRLLSAIDRGIASSSANGQRFTQYSFQGGFFSGLMIYATIAGIVYAVQTTARLRAEEARAKQAESLRTRAELEALRAQLNPHFLFNTLHSLMTLVRHDAQAAEDALERLAALLRHTLMTKTDAEDVALSEELDFVADYLALESLRHGDRLRVERNVEPEALGCKLPPFTLQPLIENSIKHSIAIRPLGGLLTIRAERSNGSLKVEIIDDGPGAKPEEIDDAVGSGLRIIRQRLMTRYGKDSGFVVKTEPGKGFSVQIQVPVD